MNKTQNNDTVLIKNYCGDLILKPTNSEPISKIQFLEKFISTVDTGIYPPLIDFTTTVIVSESIVKDMALKNFVKLINELNLKDTLTCIFIHGFEKNDLTCIYKDLITRMGGIFKFELNEFSDLNEPYNNENILFIVFDCPIKAYKFWIDQKYLFI